MKTYIKFLCNIFLKSLFYVLLVMLSLVFILNLLSELYSLIRLLEKSNRSYVLGADNITK